MTEETMRAAGKAAEELRHACRIMAMRIKGEISVWPARAFAVFSGCS